ncbi:bifunctional [glutamine synthetase] adenylyltransferase/[glutamine synthetase]-adenylyl-L-tyrosine phosphorylase [Kiloniella laminariae]|uniref:Bifunctional glutamine synthetase adenylyltransferase/adenylyl-removing enzyme n=1 Tax=Kiloniella laminariae TaxID=454162 RepID=A0ABT4LEC0_9PROT|nr:bifunctional [glutamine synthetase] adenylyltransferase/[glutamine synthetase]-adenylyl-L-tyrosine phosphorylase [Kiloniella laminariae]MCZ4279448.1 bifunctional [glutamine synthetase] adenylyltransferase/[glutamine synthetase]-adenylyl-L-tyrosine phosphorylase [Kiloniella laminariae]
MILSFSFTEETLPKNINPDRVSLGFTNWQERLERVENSDLKQDLIELGATPKAKSLLTCLFANSPYLTQCILGDMAFFCRLLKQGAEKSLTGIHQYLQESIALSTDRNQVMTGLRQAKKQASLAIGLADITGEWTDRRVVEELTVFASTAISAAVSHLLLELHKRGHLELKDPAAPEEDCGYVVLAMGKLGAWELNYSSDIDLILLFDPEKVNYLHDRGPQEGMVRLSRDLVRCLDDRTRDGYVFRTDLRLRPDPGATPLALSFNAAMTYYETTGLNWERAAMIKARPVAGDKELGSRFLREIKPFIWRKHLDFAAINDIHAIKRQIYAHKGGSRIAVKGHNIKLGRGGIREVEFFAQTQQLIWGGRNPDLRSSSTVFTLEQLHKAKLISLKAEKDLTEAYWFLRRLENRLQMIDDQQTQTLPESDEGLAAVAAFLGYDTVEDFREELSYQLHVVEDHYATLFEDEHSPPQQTKNLVFSGQEATPELISSLQEIGFTDGNRVFQLITQWKQGRYRAVRSDRSRSLIAEIVPQLLEAFGKSAAPDIALNKFDEFLSGLPTGVQLFSMLQANPNLLDLLAEIMGSAPALADRLSQSPGLLEAVLGRNFFERLPDKDVLKQQLDLVLEQARDFQDVLDFSRSWANDQRFRIGLQILRSTCRIENSSRDLAHVAECIVEALLPLTWEELKLRHGKIDQSNLAILAMGKLGSQDMTVTSDLDLISLYELSKEGQESDGDRPLDPTQYFARLTQRFTNALTALTPEGRLYEIDMRLRPSGNAGPLATTLTAFERYQLNEAWTWEHMALTRARAIAGPADFCAKINDTIRSILCQKRDPQKLVNDIASMRERIAKEKPPAGLWDIKLIRGGLIDLEFLAQYLQLRHAHESSEVLQINIRQCFQKLGELGFLSSADTADLIDATDLLHQLQNLLRLTTGEKLDEETTAPSVLKRLATTVGEPGFPELKARLEQTTERVKQIYEKTITQFVIPEN